MTSKHTYIHRLIAPRALRALSIAASLTSSSCAAPTDSGDVGAVSTAVQDGTILTGDSAGHTSGVVRLWATNTQFNELRQFCGGVLITNTLVATAAHCLNNQEAVDYGWPDLSGDTSELIVSTNLPEINAQGVGAPFYAPDGRDLALVRLDRSLPVQSRGEYMTSGFSHTLGGTPNSDAWVATVGYGELRRGVTSDKCQYISKETGLKIRGCVDDPVELNVGLGTPLVSGVEILNLGVSGTPGDSGGPTILVDGSADFADNPVIGINSLASRCVETSEGTVCGAVSARIDDLHSWFRAIAEN